MHINIFDNRKISPEKNLTQVPVWFMRQAGRYHKHYQSLKKQHSFMELCKNPNLACEVTMGPIQDFNFDAAILFSDLLFPLEQLGLGLDYDSGTPRLHQHLLTIKDCDKLKIQSPAKLFYQFQSDALKLLKNKLNPDVTLLGFVGSPWTLFTYAAEGSHSGNLISSKKGLFDGRWKLFCEVLLPELIDNMLVQANAGADAVCIFDTAAGELSLFDYQDYVAPVLNQIFEKFKKISPLTRLVYYSKWTNIKYVQCLNLKLIDVVGFDWRVDLTEAFELLPKHLYVQGNIDPGWLHLPWKQLEQRLHAYFDFYKLKNIPLNRWIAGLGHGVLIETPEENVRSTINLIHQKWH